MATSTIDQCVPGNEEPRCIATSAVDQCVPGSSEEFQVEVRIDVSIIHIDSG